ncbi:hypothetical protein BP5796_12838 [Coleophoma crateriformis]|uniref:Uncharacterized protein n=1 Tax=Coleophoma crateriformis TaxID=565419 RepID=A0A3D8Q6W7_9HELO|nr:hypothetical protein BP5796_12838 [Coleophoma crateriformis]
MPSRTSTIFGKWFEMPRRADMAGLDGCSGKPSEILFISSSDIEKADPTTRKLIRSHVMRGRKWKTSGPSKVQRVPIRRTMAARTPAVQVQLQELFDKYTQLVPGRVGSDFSCIDFPISPVASKVIFPLMAAISFQRDNQGWLYLIDVDTAALHITIFAIESFIDRILRHQVNRVNLPARLHFQEGLRLLRERLLGDDDDTRISDSTMGVVLKLAGAAHFDGDYATAKHHMEGLRRMVDLRGGLDVFQGKYLLAEMLRCDLGIAILNGSNPVFYCRPTEPVINYPERLLLASNDKICFDDNIDMIQNMDHDLAIAWQVIRRFCFMVNVGTQTQRLMAPEFVYETMTAVIYRLLHMHFANNSIAEAIRNGLLAFSYHIFLQWQDIKLPYDYFATTYKDCILGLKDIDGISSQLVLWLLMTGANAVFNIPNEAWLRDCLREYTHKCQVKDWKEMRGILKSLMWIELLGEQPEKQIYNLLQLDHGKN